VVPPRVPRLEEDNRRREGTEAEEEGKDVRLLMNNLRVFVNLMRIAYVSLWIVCFFAYACAFFIVYLQPICIAAALGINVILSTWARA